MTSLLKFRNIYKNRIKVQEIKKYKRIKEIKAHGECMEALGFFSKHIFFFSRKRDFNNYMLQIIIYIYKCIKC